MNIIWFIIGVILGFGSKLAIDQYHYFQTNQDKQNEQLEAWAKELRELKNEKDLSNKS